MWKPGTIQDKLNTRSNIVHTPQGTYTRKREFLKPSILSLQRLENMPEQEEQ